MRGEERGRGRGLPGTGPAQTEEAGSCLYGGKPA